MGSDSTIRSRVIDLVYVAVVNLAGSVRPMVVNDNIDDPLVRGERIEALLDGNWVADFLLLFRGGV
ncbi:hypothetical protein GCM10009000_035690 [Halobacterium noricense]